MDEEAGRHFRDGEFTGARGASKQDEDKSCKEGAHHRESFAYPGH